MIATGASGASAQPGSQTGTQWQVQAQLDRGPLTAGSPSSTLKRATQTVNRLQSALPGQVQFVDNLSDSLNTAAGDALYAETLFLLLAVPGALIALGVAYLAALGTSESDRRDLALLRARGARARDLLTVAGVESVIIGLVAGVLGSALGLAAVQILVSGGAQLTFWRGAATLLAAIGLGIAGSAAARLASTREALFAEVTEGRRSVTHVRRAGLAPLLPGLPGAGAERADLLAHHPHRVLSRDQPGLEPDPLPVRLHVLRPGAALDRGDPVAAPPARPVHGALASRVARRPESLSSLVVSSLGRRATAVNRGLVVIGLLLAFAVSLGVFTATYNEQAKIDAQLTLGADVTVTSPPGVAASSNLPAKVAAVPGVSATTAVNHSYAYVGPDLQDTFGIDAAHFRKATSLRDSYFLGGSADQLMSRLASTPDGILVSLETINDYSLHPGDLLRLRVLDQSTGRFRVAPFHVIGTVQEFPSAPRDSFMVANLGYLDQLTHSGPNVVFAQDEWQPSGCRLPRGGCDGTARHGGQEHRPADRSDGHLDHHGGSDRRQPPGGGLRDRAGGSGDGDLRAQRRGRAPPRVRHDDCDRRARCGRLAPSSGARSGWSWSRARCSPPGSAGCLPRCWSRC